MSEGKLKGAANNPLLFLEEKENLGRRKRIYGWKRKRRKLLNWLKKSIKKTNPVIFEFSDGFFQNQPVES